MTSMESRLERRFLPHIKKYLGKKMVFIGGLAVADQAIVILKVLPRSAGRLIEP
jgi:hypothetical protein